MEKALTQNANTLSLSHNKHNDNNNNNQHLEPGESVVIYGWSVIQTQHSAAYINQLIFIYITYINM